MMKLVDMLLLQNLHHTQPGAAIDITLITNAKSELDLGTEFNKAPQETENATYFNSENIALL